VAFQLIISSNKYFVFQNIYIIHNLNYMKKRVLHRASFW